MKKMITLILMVMLSVGVLGTPHDFTQARQLVESKVSCSDLNDSQLEQIGDYYMEQMHPGNAHELMDEMHGGDGSATLQAMHRMIAKRIYCGEDSMGMMNSMMAGQDNQAMQGGMMGVGMMQSMGANNIGGNQMMASQGYGYWIFWQVLLVLLVVGLIALIYYSLFKLIGGKK